MYSTEISVIIPAYNSGDFIETTLKSVLNQTFLNFEIIVIDDGSQDNTKEVIEKWQKKDIRIKYFYQKNGGVASARNEGMNKASGRFITFLDSDDTFEPEFLEKMYLCINATHANMCFSGYKRHCQNRLTRCEPTYFDIPDVLSFIITEQWISTDSWLIRREFLQEEQIYFTKDFSYAEDFEFFSKLIYLSGHSITCVAEYLTHYNYRDNSLTSRNSLWHSLSYITGSLAAYKSLYHFIKSRPGESYEFYLALLSQKIKKFYVRCLWGTLLLDSAENFNMLYLNYQKDYIPYNLKIKIHGRKYHIWKLIISHRILRTLGKYIFRPYKYFQRQIVIHYKSNRLS